MFYILSVCFNSIPWFFFGFNSSWYLIVVVKYQLYIKSLIFLFVHNSWCALDFNVLYCMVVALEVFLSPEMSFIVPWLWSLSSVCFVHRHPIFILLRSSVMFGVTCWLMTFPLYLKFLYSFQLNVTISVIFLSSRYFRVCFNILPAL